MTLERWNVSGAGRARHIDCRHGWFSHEHEKESDENQKQNQ
jgi:hypothetical protein